ncbi:MAG: hypothetical protein M1812_005469 [Candelaria pacifica]|nr:MAG: hypothetical protein M1812_005469 [Candelaria pacifica]
MATSRVVSKPLIQQQIEIVEANRQHALHKYFGPAAWEGYQRLFFCNCQTPSLAANAGRRTVSTVAPDFVANLFPTLAEKYVIYGVIGAGTFGAVFAARDRRPSNSGKIRHYAIKVQFYSTHQNYNTDILTARHMNGRYTHKEAFTLHFLKKCTRISQIHEAGIHGEFAVIVMDQFGVIASDEMKHAADVTLTSDHRVEGLVMYASNGAHFITADLPRLVEVQVCKITSDILEALLFLNDRNIAHLDMGLRNILVDDKLRAQLIDFDQCKLAINDSDFKRRIANFVYAQENHMSPELLKAMNKYRVEGNPGQQKNVRVDYDIRDEQLWKFGCMIFELLHGYAPFTDRAQLKRNQRAVIFGGYGRLNESEEIKDRRQKRDRRYRKQRRGRILNEPLQFAEEIDVIIPGTPKRYQQQHTQEAIDVLQAMFLKNRLDRPSVEELASFPWFQGSFMDAGWRFERPGGLTREVWRGPLPTDLDKRPTDSLKTPSLSEFSPIQ